MALNRPHPHGRERARLDAECAPLLSLLDHREVLSLFLGDPRVPLEKNASERVLCGPIIARCTSFDLGGPEGDRVERILFGVFATVRLVGLNRYA